MFAEIWKKLYEFFVQVILIVVGVLSALAVDNYRESIQEHKNEKEYLANLRTAIETDTVTLKTEIRRTYEKIRAISELIKLSETRTTIGNDEFGNLVTDIIMLIRPNFVTAVYEELKFTGNFKLIRNNEIKSLIISYYSDNATILEQNEREVGIHPTHFMDIISFEEMEFHTPFDQQRILNAIRNDNAIKSELLLLQKRTSIIRSGMIYTSLPRSLDLLDKLQAELTR